MLTRAVYTLLVLAAARSAAATSSLAFVPAGTFNSSHTALFEQAIQALRGAAPCISEYSRHGGAHRSATRPMGGILVLPPEQRRVRVVDGFRTHLDAASLLHFPLDSRLRASALPADMLCAIARSVELGPRLERERNRLTNVVESIAFMLRPLSDIINRLMPPTVARIAAKVNTAFMAATVDALRWLDTLIVQRFVFGFPVVGDIPDSGVYRAIDATVSQDTAEKRFAFFQQSAPVWNRMLHDRLADRANAPAAGRAADIAVATKSTAERDRGLIVGPFPSSSALRRSIAANFPTVPWDRMCPRILNRFGIDQKGSIRAIDDGRSNGANFATRLVETVTTPHFYVSAVVARAAAEAASSRGLPCPVVTVALADLTAAYRTIPTSQPWFTTIGFFNPLLAIPAPEYYWLPGHNFGLTAAVVNFNRFPELVVVAARAVAIAACEHYYDDFICNDAAAGGTSALRAIERIVLALGSPRRKGDPIQSPELDPSKTRESACTHVVLGIVTDLTQVCEGQKAVVFRPDPERVKSVLAMFRDAFIAGKLTPHMASRIRGKLFFLLSSAYGMVGRAATLPLVQRQYRDATQAFTVGSELHHSYLFFRALLPRLPPLTMYIVPDPVPPLLIYTDAAFSRRKRKSVSGECESRENTRDTLNGGLGAVVYDPVDGTVRYAAAKPSWDILLSSWRTDRKTYIAELETLAAISVYTTYPSLIAGRKVNHFIDNTVALSALVHGYSGKPDLAKAVNVFYLQMIALRASVFFDFVPSKGNIADLPSRFAYTLLESELIGLDVRGERPDVLAAPDVAAWTRPLESWATLPEFADRKVPL
jgi:hypothetical protein